jgi:uncharacterized protein YdaU (DUF1376 family)
VHYYKRNLGDYAKKAGRLSMLQHGAYTLLIDACYDREQFPTLDEAIDWTWASSSAEIEAVEFVLRKFFTLEDGRHVQKRIQEEIDAYRVVSETNARIARDRETNRANNNTKRARPVNDTPRSGNEAPPNQEPLTNNQEPKEEGKPPRKRDATLPVACPDDVDGQTWTDWLHLRKTKRAPVTPTVVNGARSEAEKAGMDLDAFLQVWCTRGSQGLQADWLKPDERQVRSRAPQSFAQQDEQARRRKWEQMTGRQWPADGATPADAEFIDAAPTPERIEA